MRLIAEDPEFTWDGTIFIVAAFTIFGFTQSIVAIARQRGEATMDAHNRSIDRRSRVPAAVRRSGRDHAADRRRRWVRASTRVGWHRLARAICLLAALGPVVLVGSQLVGSFGWSARALVGFLAMLAIYGTIVATTRFTVAAAARRRRAERSRQDRPPRHRRPRTHLLLGRSRRLAALLPRAFVTERPATGRQTPNAAGRQSRHCGPRTCS